MGTGLLKGLGIGAALMYLYDPVQGRRRRSLVRDQAVAALHRFERGLDRGVRDLNNRLNGFVSEAPSMLIADHAPDHILVERVRAKMGRYVSHPGAVQVTAHDGRVVLSGAVLGHEVHDFLQAVQQVRGVRDVESQLEVHDDTNHISSLQGGRARIGQRWDVLQENWSPATRLVASGAGCLLMVNCLGRRTLGSMLGGALGLGLFLRATMTTSPQQLLGVSPQQRPADLRRSVFIRAPRERVFEFAMDYHKLAEFIDVVEEVEDLGEGRLCWTLVGPAGVRMKLHETLTRVEPNERIEWRSDPEETLAYQGTARFIEDHGGTRIDIHLAFTSPAGAVSQMAASTVRADLLSMLDRGISRIKQHLESEATSPRPE